mmetsp:Transcript_15405/g.60207  ORF Transcript_15405/g.60207 Transcript_15405/m.60207 type:complete len:251 (-) Transcript_15405:1116-1868(-)
MARLCCRSIRSFPAMPPTASSCGHSRSFFMSSSPDSFPVSCWSRLVPAWNGEDSCSTGRLSYTDRSSPVSHPQPRSCHWRASSRRAARTRSKRMPSGTGYCSRETWAFPTSLPSPSCSLTTKASSKCRRTATGRVSRLLWLPLLQRNLSGSDRLTTPFRLPMWTKCIFSSRGLHASNKPRQSRWCSTYWRRTRRRGGRRACCRRAGRGAICQYSIRALSACTSPSQRCAATSSCAATFPPRTRRSGWASC